MNEQSNLLSKMKNIYKNYGVNSILIFNELYNYSLIEYFDINYFNEKIFNNIYFQVLTSILVINKYCKFIHFDLHGGNILIKNINISFDNVFNTCIKNDFSSYNFNTESWCYNINNNKYEIDNYGILKKICDFVRSIKYVDKNNIFKNLLKNLKRFFIN